MNRKIGHLKEITALLAVGMLGIFNLAQAHQPSSNTVVDIVVNSEVHNTLEAAVIAADLAGTLSGDGPFTVFAPTDEAFAALPEGTIDALLADPSGDLTQILLYHTAGAKALSTDLTNGMMVTTLNGKEVEVRFEGGNVFINDAQVTVADIEADNGVVHVINAVLIPSATTVVDIVVNSENHNTLEAAVIAADLAGTLSGDGPFTVFAPTDAAFAALPEGTIDALLADPSGDLTQILLYHVAGAKALSTDLTNGMAVTTLNGKNVEVKIEGENVFINDAQVTVADIEADNGVVHVIDVVLQMPTGLRNSAISENSLKIYPNPSSGSVNIEIPDTDMAQIDVIQSNGKIIKSMNASSASFVLNLHDLESGPYEIVLRTDKGITSKGLILHK